VRRVVRSAGWGRARVGIGAVAALLGVVLLVRTIATIGFRWEALTNYVLSAALIGLGYVRWREYQSRGGP
jgi:hypothetical protein